jgi:molybdopterin synthase catalytic subunit
VQAPGTGDTWIGVTDAALSVGAAYDWCVVPSCGAVVLFSGTVRDHADGREGVEHLTYEAYEEHAVAKMAALVDELRARWPMVVKVVLLHRVGRLELGESSVLVVVSSPHRPEAFEAARFGIDALKASVPIWKHEVWNGGEDWALGAQHLVEASEVPTAPSAGATSSLVGQASEPIVERGVGADHR